MIALAALLVLVAVALLIGGLGNGDTTLLWAAVGVSVLAAAVLVVQTLQRKRAGVTADGGPAAEGSVAAAAALQATAPPADEPTVDGPTTPETPAPAGSHAARPVGAGGPAVGADGGPPEEEVEVTDLLIVLDLTDEVVVLDEHPRYHLTGCSQTAGQVEIPLPLDEAREDGFTACGVCRPDSHLADRERARRAATG